MSLPSTFGVFSSKEKLMSIQDVAFAWPVEDEEDEEDEEKEKENKKEVVLQVGLGLSLCQKV